MPTRLRAVVLFLTLLPSYALSQEHPDGDRAMAGVTPFNINRDKPQGLTKAVARFKTANSQREVNCEFSYETATRDQKAPPPPPAKTDEGGGAIGSQAAIRALDGTCVEQITGHDYWMFRVCIGREVTQYHDAERYQLGKYNPSAPPLDQGTSQKYDSGQMCDTKPRESTVHFNCGDVPGIVRVSEPAPCTYQIDVTHPSLCANPNFARVAAIQSQGSQQIANPQDQNIENWFLELSQDTDGRVGCAVHNIAQAPKIIFTKFEMRLISSNTPLKISGDVKARKPQRVRLHPSEYTVEPQVVKHTDQFGGGLELLSVWSLDPQ